MPIQINAPDLSGLNARSGGNLNLPVPGALGLQAMQAATAQSSAMQNAALERQRLGQQFVLQSGQQNLMRDQMQQQGLLSQQGYDIDQQKMAAIAAQNQISNQMDAAKMGQVDRQFGLAEKQFGQVEKQANLEAQQKEMAKLIDMDKNALKERGAFASYGLMSLKGAKTPEEAQQIKSEILKEAVSKNLLPKDQADQIRKMPLSQTMGAFGQFIMAAGMAKEFKDMNDVTAEKSKSGTNIEFNPDGSIASLSVDPTSTVKSETMKDLKGREIGLQKLAVIRDKFDPNYFTYANAAGRGAAATAELSKGIPGLEQATELAAGVLTGKNPEERGKDLQGATTYFNSVQQFFNDYRKEITGAAAAEKELARLEASFINKDLSASQFKGALDQLVGKYTSEAEFNKNVLRQGLDTAPRDDKRQRLEATGKYTKEQIDAYLGAK